MNGKSPSINTLRSRKEFSRKALGALGRGALIAGIPVALLYTFFLDRIISGLAGGKGQ